MPQRWINFTAQSLRLFTRDQPVAQADEKEWNFVIHLILSAIEFNHAVERSSEESKEILLPLDGQFVIST